MTNPIETKPGYTWENLQVAKVHHMIDLDWLTNQLVKMRKDWITATHGDMTHVTLDLELLFDDILELLKGGK